jgi:hypothetical protein
MGMFLPAHFVGVELFHAHHTFVMFSQLVQQFLMPMGKSCSGSKSLLQVRGIFSTGFEVWDISVFRTEL